MAALAVMKGQGNELRHHRHLLYRPLLVTWKCSAAFISQAWRSESVLQTACQLTPRQLSFAFAWILQFRDFHAESCNISILEFIFQLKFYANIKFYWNWRIAVCLLLKISYGGPARPKHERRFYWINILVKVCYTGLSSFPLTIYSTNFIFSMR